jgi:hypothetical protein
MKRRRRFLRVIRPSEEIAPHEVDESDRLLPFVRSILVMTAIELRR